MVMTVGGVAPTARGNAVLLVDAARKKAVPIFVGDTEALSIQLRLEKKRYSRPLTHDLLDTTLKQLGAKVEAVRVERVVDNVFHGSVILRQGDKSITLDARTSDAVAIALGNQVPIQVAKEVVEKAAMDLDDVHPAPASSGQGRNPISL